MNIDHPTRLPSSAPILIVFLGMLIAATAPTRDVFAQTSGPTSREAMWFAPTAEDWKKPCLIKWQRTWDDAVALSKETKKPILVCVNMDGEIASEHYAGVRYRQPEIAKLYEPYVTVIASVYRHTPRDYDEDGKRVLCPRFGGVTCGEHITIEPIIYEKFLDGRRIAPRHIMVELDGKEVYDVFYAWDTASVFQAITDGIAKRKDPPPPYVRGDRSIVERVGSPDNEDKTAVEKTFLAADKDTKRALLEAAAQKGDAASLDLLRLAVFGLDTDMSKIAREALAKSSSKDSVDLIADALRVPMETGERNALIGALERIGEGSSKAKTLSVIHKGLESRSSTVDLDNWAKAFEGGSSYAAAATPDARDEKIAAQDEVFKSSDAERHVELADSFLGEALDDSTDRDRFTVRALLTDALETAKKAEKLGANGWKVHAVAAVAEYYLGNVDEARRRSELAVQGMPPDPEGRTSMVVLGLFAEARKEAISKALSEKKEWPGQWLTDVNAAYAVLAKHPLGDDSQIAAHIDFLRWLRAWGKARQVLDTGLERFPDSGLLHDRLRSRILAERGFEGLEAEYEKRMAAPNATVNTPWFAAYAAMIVAEFHRRNAAFDEANAAYDRAVKLYETTIAKNPPAKSECDHFIAMAWAGRGRVAYEKKDYEAALQEIVRSFEKKPTAAASFDGLNVTAVDTAKMLRVRFKDMNRPDLSQKLEEALSKLDPKMLELPAYEREVPPPGQDSRPAESRPNRRRPRGGE